MDNFTFFRGELRAAVAVGAAVRFVTEHPEGLPTALYEFDAEGDSSTVAPLPCGGRAIAASGETTYVGGTDGRVYVAVGNEKPRALTEPFDAPVAALAPVCGDRLALLSGKELHLVSCADGSRLQAFELPDAGTALGCDPTGQWLAVGTARGTVTVFDAQDKPEFEPGESAKLHDGAVTALVFEPEELRFFSAGADGKLLTTHARGELEPEDKGRGNAHAEPVAALIYLPAGDRLVSGGRDKLLKNWPRAGAMKPVTLEGTVGRVVALTLVTAHDIAHVAALCDDGTIRLVPLAADGRFDDDLDDLAVWRGALDWARDQLAATWDSKRRERALEQLAQWGDAACLDLIAEQVGEDQEPAVRLTGTALLGVSESPRAATLLEPLVNHFDPTVRAEAFRGLRSRLGSEDPRPVDLALASGKPEVGVLALMVLEKRARADDQALAKVVGALDAPAWEVRSRAVEALETVYDRDAARAVLTALGAARADVRALALGRAFARELLADPAVLAAVRRRLEDDDAAVRKVAFLLALQARPKLAAALRARDPELHRQLIELERTEAKQPAPATPRLADADYDVLLQATASRPLDTCLRGANGLARLGDPRAFPLLLQLSREEPEAARVEVCRALAALGDPRAVNRLRSMLGDAQAPVRDAAYTAVARLSAPLTAAEAGLTAPHEDVRRRGLETLLAETRKSPPQGEASPGFGLFVRALNDPAPAVRREAFKAALNQNVAGGGEATLRFALRSVHADVRREVLGEVQARSGEPFAKALAYEFFDDPDAALRAEAFESATKKDKELAPLQAALASRHADARLLAVAALYRKHSRAAQAVILRAVADPDARVRERAVAALVDDDARGPLAEALAADYPDARVRAAAALARLGEPASLAVLRESAFAPEPAEQFRRGDWLRLAELALGGLGSLGDEGVFDGLLRLAESPLDSLRAGAAAALASCTPDAGRGRVAKLLAHADPAVRRGAALALAARGDATVHPVLFADGAADADRLGALLAAEPANREPLAELLDAADEAARRPALMAHLLLERADADGVPDLLLQALAARGARVRLAAAGGLEAFGDPAAFARFVVDAANDRGEESDWKLTAEMLDPLAAVLAFAPPLARFQAGRLLTHFAEKESARLRQEWTLFAARNKAAVAGAVARLALAKSALSQAELRELAFGAYVGLTREQGGGGGTGVARVRQTALSRVSAIAAQDKAYARSARPVFTQALADPNQAVRFQAFDHLQALGLPSAELGAEALESGSTDLGVRGLELLTDGTSSKEGQGVLERVMLGRTDDLATESAKLLAKSRGLGAVAAAALEAVHEPLRIQAVNWLAAGFDEEPAAQAALRAAVGSRYRRVREEAAYALAVKRDPAAFDTLGVLLREATDAARQTRLTLAFQRLGDARAAGVLLDRVETDPTGTASTDELIEAAGSFRDESAVGRLLAMGLRKEEWRSAAIHAVYVASGFDQTAPDPEQEAAFAKAEREQFPRRAGVLARLIEALTATGDIANNPTIVADARAARTAEVDAPLAALVAHPDAEVRVVALTAIGGRAKSRGGPVEPLLKALRHKDPRTQFAAAEGLAKNRRPEGMQVLLSGIEYVDDVALRERAVTALGELADPRSVDTLLKLATEDGHALQEPAAEAIGHLGQSAKADEVAKALERLAQSPRWGVATRAIAGLRHLNSVDGWRAVRALAKSPNSNVRHAACTQLGYDGDPATRLLLLDALRSESDSGVYGVALQSATRLLGPESAEPYYAAILNPYSEYLIAAVDRVPVDVACERGDPLRLLELFPRCRESVQAKIEASLSGRAAVPVAEATAALTHADDATVRLAARLLAGASGVPRGTGQAVAAAQGAWLARWGERRAELERVPGASREPLERATSALRALFWAGSQLGAGGATVAEVAAARPGDRLARPLQLIALRALGTTPDWDAAATRAVESLAAGDDPEARSLAAALLTRREPRRAALLIGDQLSDKPTFARVAGAGGAALAAARDAAARPDQQSVALPVLVAAKEVALLAKVAGDAGANLNARLGAAEGLGAMADAGAEQQLADLATALKDAKGDGVELRKAAWRALRRSRRARVATSQGVAQ